jgi:hypothetical protein
MRWELQQLIHVTNSIKTSPSLPVLLSHSQIKLFSYFSVYSIKPQLVGNSLLAFSAGNTQGSLFCADIKGLFVTYLGRFVGLYEI